MKNNKLFERIVHGIFLILGLVTVACVLLITVYLVVSGIPAIMEIGFGIFCLERFGSQPARMPNLVSCLLSYLAFTELLVH